MTDLTDRVIDVFTGGSSNGEHRLPVKDLVVMERGHGAKLWDTSGREFLDFSMAWGSCLVGHAREEVVKAVTRQAPLGSNFAYLNTQVLALAEEIQRVSPAAERFRFCASGTEATILGVVGAGGIGWELYFAIIRFEFEQAATAIIMILILTTAIDRFSQFLRHKII